MMIMSSSYCVHKGKAGRPSGTESRDIGIRTGLVVLATGEHHHVRLGGPAEVQVERMRISLKMGHN